MDDERSTTRARADRARSRRPAADRARIRWRTVGIALCSFALAAPAAAVDGVIEINRAKALAGGVTPGDAPGFPVSITAPGSYRLTGSLDVPDANTTAIRITTHDVTLDLNGFAIVGPNTCLGAGTTCSANGSGAGIDASDPFTCYDRTTVTNGIVRGMGGAGIVLGCRESRVESVSVSDVGGFGIFAGAISTIAHNRLTRIGGSQALTSGVGSTIEGNSILFMAAQGIVASDTSTVIGNTVKFGMIGINASVGIVRDNVILSATSFGLTIAGGGGYADNVLRLNNGGDANPQVSGGIQLGANVCGTDTVCP